ncbi:MAG TPA: gamma-glutamyltransferase [Actinomycetota bacterium]|nr:gamma-glutamyltransferase [Actinomycetota bacterium]
MTEPKLFPRGCVASPHYLASSAGLAVLASGGNALDAAIATNLTLGVVTPYLCGYGGDLFALVWDGSLHAYNGSGRAPAAATVEAVRAAAGTDVMPALGPHAVTVPGAVEAWFALLDQFGTRSFADLAQTALRYASDGFQLSARGAASIVASRAAYTQDFAADWRAVYGNAGPQDVLRQPDLARTIRTLCDGGPDAYYRGEIAAAIADTVQRHGGLLQEPDLASHTGEWVEPMSTTYRGHEIVELPPNTQGVTVLEALNVFESLDEPGEAESLHRHHLLIESMKLALHDREAHVTDPRHMTVPAATLGSKERARDRAGEVDPVSARKLVPGSAAGGGTVYLCAADESGMCVSLIQSNYMGFGSAVTVPGWGINLHNRGAFFSLDPTHVNAMAPGKRTMHTLIPAMVMRAGRPAIVFGTMGGDGQAQTHLQLLTRILDDGLDVQAAIDAPRWMVSPRDWTVSAESRFDAGVVDGLRARGHEVRLGAAFDARVAGHAHAIAVTPAGYAAATDPRAEGAAIGL